MESMSDLSETMAGSGLDIKPTLSASRKGSEISENEKKQVVVLPINGRDSEGISGSGKFKVAEEHSADEKPGYSEHSIFLPQVHTQAVRDNVWTPLSQEILLQRAKQGCLILHDDRSFLGLGCFGFATKDFLRISTQSARHAGYYKLRSLLPGFGEAEAVVNRYDAGPSAAIEFAEIVPLQSGQSFSEESGFLHWSDQWVLNEGETATIFGFNGSELIACSGSILFPAQDGQGLAVINCSLGKMAFGSPVLNSRGSLIGLVVEDWGEVMAFMATPAIKYWMRKKLLQQRRWDEYEAEHLRSERPIYGLEWGRRPWEYTYHGVNWVNSTMPFLGRTHDAMNIFAPHPIERTYERYRRPYPMPYFTPFCGKLSVPDK